MPNGSVLTVANPFVTADDDGRADGGRDPVPASVSPARDERQPFDLAGAYDEHAAVMFGFAVNALRDRGLAEDCVQETFLRAWRARERFDPARATLRTWLFAIERNVIIDVQRSLQRTPRIGPPDGLDELPADSVDPLERLRIAEALASLSDEHRDVVVAVHLDGATYAELAETTGVPAATLRTRAFYALRALRARLGRGDST